MQAWGNKYMSKLMNQPTDEELKSYPISNILNGWFFRVDEISYEHYRATAIDKWGKSVSRDGNDPDELLQICTKDILEIFSWCGDFPTGRDP